MAPGDRSSSGRAGGDRPVVTGLPAAKDPSLPDRSLALQLVIAGTEPLSGSVGPENSTLRVGFSGWIGLMSAINDLLAGWRDSGPEPLVR